MQPTMQPAIVLKSKFVLPTAKTYNSYIQYMDRADAKLNVNIGKSDKIDDFSVYHTFMDYMGDEFKEGDLFTFYQNTLSDTDKKYLRKIFSEAEKKGSPMWQDVISFDNTWLAEQGLYNPNTHWLNEGRMKDIVRAAVTKMIKEEGMVSPIWSASFHYNTDNIHVHIATVERAPEQLKKMNMDGLVEYRGLRKQKTLEQVKSVVANQIVDRTPALKRIDSLIRDTVKQKRTFDTQAFSKTAQLFAQALEVLPTDLKQWQYGYQTINEARPYIDKITDIYLATYHPGAMEKLVQELDEQVILSERLYGSGSNYKTYKDKKLHDLKTRMGNAVLSELRDYERGIRAQHSTSKKEKLEQQESMIYAHHFFQKRGINEMHRAVFQLNKVLRKSYQEHQKDRNLDEFDRMLEGYK